MRDVASADEVMTHRLSSENEIEVTTFLRVEKEVRYDKRKEDKTHCMPSTRENFLFYLVISYVPR
jgi:hypothetical protein